MGLRLPAPAAEGNQTNKKSRTSSFVKSYCRFLQPLQLREINHEPSILLSSISSLILRMSHGYRQQQLTRVKLASASQSISFPDTKRSLAATRKWASVLQSIKTNEGTTCLFRFGFKDLEASCQLGMFKCIPQNTCGPMSVQSLLDGLLGTHCYQAILPCREHDPAVTQLATIYENLGAKPVEILHQKTDVI